MALGFLILDFEKFLLKPFWRFFSSFSPALPYKMDTFFRLNLLGIASIASSGAVEQLISEHWVSLPVLFVFAGIIAPRVRRTYFPRISFEWILKR